MDVSKRNSALDITRIAAMLSVISIHFFLNSGYYNVPMLGDRMLVLTIIRTAFTHCVPLFIMLSGYLLNKKTFSGKYYLGITKTFGIYVLASVECMLYKAIEYGADYSPKAVFFGILDFTGANYSWYIEMYIGLFLLIPFINAMYNGLADRRAKKALIITLIVMTCLPSAVNIYNFTVEGWFDTPYLSTSYQKLIPEWWTRLYPITYYVIGAYLKEYPIRMKKWLNITLLVSAIAVFGTFNYYRSWGGFFSWGKYTDWYGLPTLILTVLVFILCSTRDTSKFSVRTRKILAHISDLCLGAYLVSYIFDDIFYYMLAEAVPVATDRIYFFIPMVLIVAAASLAMSFVLNIIYSVIEYIIKEAVNALRDKLIKKNKSGLQSVLSEEPPVLETERLILRPFGETDVGALYEFAKDTEVAHNAGWKPHETLEDSRNMIKLFMSGKAGLVWAVESKAEAKAVGAIVLSENNKLSVAYDLEIGYVLSKSQWGQELMCEAAGKVIDYAFSKLGCETVAAAYYDGNERSKRVLEKLGFTYVTRLTGCTVRYDGVVLSKNVYTLSVKDAAEKSKLHQLNKV